MRRLRTEILSLIEVRVKDKGDFVSLLGMVCVKFTLEVQGEKGVLPCDWIIRVSKMCREDRT